MVKVAVFLDRPMDGHVNCYRVVTFDELGIFLAREYISTDTFYRDYIFTGNKIQGMEEIVYEPEYTRKKPRRKW